MRRGLCQPRLNDARRLAAIVDCRSSSGLTWLRTSDGWRRQGFDKKLECLKHREEGFSSAAITVAYERQTAPVHEEY
jgi:hypothetical protein